MKIIISSIFAILLTGCAAPFSTPNVNPNFKTGDIETGTAVVILSITNNQAKQRNGLNSLPPQIYFFNEDKTQKLNILGNAGSFFEKHIVNEDNWTIGRVAAIRVTPGKYKFTGFNTTINLFQVYSAAKDIADLSFTVMPNEVVYIGNIDLYNLPSSEKYSISVSDEFPRDSIHIQEKWPNISIKDIKKRLALLTKVTPQHNQSQK